MLKKKWGIFSFFSSGRQQNNLPPVSKVSIAIVIVAALLVVLSAFLIPEGGEDTVLTVGTRLKKNIFARKDYTKEDTLKSTKEKEKLRENIPHVYQIDPDAQLKVLDELEAAFYRYLDINESSKAKISGDNQIWTQLQSQDPAWQKEFRARLTALYKSGQLTRHFIHWRNSILHGILPDDTEYDTVTAGQKDPVPLRQIIVYNSELEFERSAEDHTAFDREKEFVNRMVNDLSPENVKLRNYLQVLLSGLIEPNLKYDKQKTEELLTKLAEDRKIYHVVHEGQILFKRDQLITEADVKLFQDYQQSLNQNKHNIGYGLRVIQQSFLLVTLLILLAIYIRRNHPEVLNRSGAVALFIGIVLLSLLVNRLCAELFISLARNWNLPNALFYLALPLAMPALLVATFFGLRTAIYVGIFTSIAAAAALGNSYPTFIAGLMLCGFGALAVYNVFDYKKFFGRIMVTTTVISFFSSSIFLGDYLFRDQYGDNLWHSLLIGLIAMPLASGFITALCTLLMLFLLESIFHVASNMAYLTFTDRNHALLKELSVNAPGTYQHCDRVAMLGEKAAAVVGLDPIRIQACALFHDVGKLKYPTMFTENNTSGENRFMNMPPQESVRYIKEHVTYGQELAKEYKLPWLLRRAIESHHGTDFISFFYEQAKKAGMENLNEAEFHYDGPLAQEKEVALLGLADCCEAAVQSIADPTPEKIRSMVETLFDRKIRSGQLDQSGFTLNDINRIRESFLETLTAAHKKRIAYPGNKQ